jgi:hypothetical protein
LFFGFSEVAGWKFNWALSLESSCDEGFLESFDRYGGIEACKKVPRISKKILNIS